MIVYDYNDQTTVEAHNQVRDDLGQLVTTEGLVEGNPDAVTTNGEWNWGIGVLDRSAGHLRVYVNSAFVGQASFSGLSTISFPSLTLGSVVDQTPYSARLTDVDRLLIFDHALTQDEINNIDLVPEPASLLVMGMSLCVLRRSSQRKNRT